MTKQMKFDADARQEFKAGVAQIGRAVALTMSIQRWRRFRTRNILWRGFSEMVGELKKKP